MSDKSEHGNLSRWTNSTAELDKVLTAVATEFQLSRDLLFHGGRKPYVAFARQVAMALLVEKGFALGQVGIWFKRSSWTASYASGTIQAVMETEPRNAARIERIRKASA